MIFTQGNRRSTRLYWFVRIDSQLAGVLSSVVVAIKQTYIASHAWNLL